METRFAGLSIEGDAVCCSALAAHARLQTELAIDRQKNMGFLPVDG